MDNNSDPTKLDTAAVEAWLTAHLPGFKGPIKATKFADGQSNPTFRLDTPSGRYVLRRKPPGKLLKSAHAVDREFRVQSALAGTDVPVAKMYVLCEDDDVIGSMFYIMEMVDARNFFDPRLPEVNNDERGEIFDDMNRVLAAIHDVDIDAVGLSDYGPEGNYYERQISRWTKQYRAAETERLAPMEELIEWLGAHMPADDGQRTLVHGDFRIDNMLFDKKDPRCVAVLDWELSTIGHPYADLAAVIMQWRMAPGGMGRGLAGVDRGPLNIPTDEEFVAKYCERRGISSIPDFNFYLAFTFFRMAGIIQGVYKRALDGNASNPERGIALGANVGNFAQFGLEAAKNG
ncbi:phosphotransferase family protein [Aliiroseovarius sp. PTFE2010]|uniref:phosphotransferase family protein n=1 Tax=Aliiroseovarius sp. PTFE2010 TaxID=3417190 RepID=UPI003CEFD0AE